MRLTTLRDAQVAMAVERDEQGNVRTSNLNDPWEPDFARITKRDARTYTSAELRYWLTENGRRRWWRLENGWLGGRTPEQALNDGDLELVWHAAAGPRDQGGS